jgi:hypothetical protein
MLELAALVATHGPVLIRGNWPIPQSTMDEYWAASKCRLDRWGRTLKAIAITSLPPTPTRRLAHREYVRSVMEEILAGEVLTRVFSGMAAAYDRRRGREDAEIVSRSVLLGQMEIRHRALKLLLQAPGIRSEDALDLNRLRRRTERWADLLLGYLMLTHDVSEFAIEPRRARAFADDLRDDRRVAGGEFAWQIMLASLRTAFREAFSHTCPNGDMNARIAAAILGCFPAELFDSRGLFQSSWLARMLRVTDETQVLIDDLFESQEQPLSRQAASFLERFRRG